MIRRLCLGLLLCMTAHGKKLIQVAPGSDVSESCVGSQSSWDRTGTSGTELKLDNTAHLLMQNFQQHDKGLYRCGDKEITLEEKSASAGDTTLLYRAVGQPVHLFCKFLGSETCRGTWKPRPNPPERKRNHGRDGDYSLHISSVRWGDSGVFSCQRRCNGRQLTQTSYDLVVVKATVEPQRVYEGGDVTLRCSLSHLKTPGQVCWIYLDTNNHHYSRRYRSYSSHCKSNAAAVSHTVSNIRSDQSQWACAVFYEGTLRALLPVQLNVSTHTTTHTKTVRRATSLRGTHSDSSQVPRNSTATQPTDSSAGVIALVISVMSVCGLLVVILVVLAALLLRKVTNKEVCEDEDERKTADEEACPEGLLPNRGTVMYASVHFKRKPPEDLNKVSSDVAATDPPAAAGGTEEEDATVIYAGLKMNSCS